MNLQLFGYDDGFYYGQCRLICIAESSSDNGKTVSITGGGRSFSATIVDQIATFLLPGRNEYTVAMIDNSITEWSGKVYAGYGECIELHLADGYDAIYQKDRLTLAEIEIATGSLADYVPDADAVKQLNNNLTANNNPFKFAYDSISQKYGYTVPVGGADTFVPFRKEIEAYRIANSGINWAGNSHYTCPTEKKVKYFAFVFRRENYLGIFWNNGLSVNRYYQGNVTENWATCTITDNSITINSKYSEFISTCVFTFLVYEQS